MQTAARIKRMDFMLKKFAAVYLVNAIWASVEQQPELNDVCLRSFDPYLCESNLMRLHLFGG